MGFNPFGLFGESDADYQAKIQGQQAAASAAALKADASQNSVSGQGYVNQAGNQYGSIYGSGQKESSSSWDNLQNYMQQYANAAGIKYASPGANPFGNPGGVPNMQSTNKYGTGYVPTLAASSPGNNAPNGRVPTGYIPGGTTQPSTIGGTVATGYNPSNPSGTPGVGNGTNPSGAAGATSGPLDSPFALDQNSQQALNQSIDKINAERKTALDNYNSSTAQPLPEFQRQINQHYDELNNQATTAAGQAAQAQRVQAAQQMMTQLTGLLTSGNQQQLAGTGGTANLGTTQLGLAASELGGAANLTQNASNVARQNQINQDNQLNQLLAYGITMAAGGVPAGGGGGSSAGFGLPSTPTSYGAGYDAQGYPI